MQGPLTLGGPYMPEGPFMPGGPFMLQGSFLPGPRRHFSVGVCSWHEVLLYKEVLLNARRSVRVCREVLGELS